MTLGPHRSSGSSLYSSFSQKAILPAEPGLEQSFNFNVYYSPLGKLAETQISDFQPQIFLILYLKWGLEVCISNRNLGN